MKSPCRKCDDRAEGCHGNCERYKEWSEAHKAEKAERKAMTKAETDIVVFRSEMIQKLKKKQGKK